MLMWSRFCQRIAGLALGIWACAGHAAAAAPAAAPLITQSLALVAGTTGRMTSRIVMIALMVGLAAATVAVAAPVRVAHRFTLTSTTDAVDAHPGDGQCRTAAGECTLRAAIQETNALPGADLVVVPSGLYTLTIPGTGEDAAATGDLDITDALTLRGAGPQATIVDGGGLDCVFQLPAPVTVTIAGRLCALCRLSLAPQSSHQPRAEGRQSSKNIYAPDRMTIRWLSAYLSMPPVHAVR
jgi:CSLREA domain-containing protein